MIQLPFVWMLFVGCQAPPYAPSDLDSLMGFVFAEAGAEESEALEQALINLDVWLTDNMESTKEGYQVRDLAPEVMQSLARMDEPTANGSAVPPVSAEALIGASVGHPSLWEADWLGTWNAIDDDYDPDAEVNPQEHRHYLTDPFCFRDRTCDTLRAEEWSTDELPLFVTSVSHFIEEWRRVAIPAGPAIIQRWWLDRPIDFNVSFINVYRQYYLFAFVPREDGSSVSAQATWVQAEFAGSPMPVGAALSLVVTAMQDTAQRLDNSAAAWHGVDHDTGSADTDQTDTDGVVSEAGADSDAEFRPKRDGPRPKP